MRLPRHLIANLLNEHEATVFKDIPAYAANTVPTDKNPPQSNSSSTSSPYSGPKSSTTMGPTTTNQRTKMQILPIPDQGPGILLNRHPAAVPMVHLSHLMTGVDRLKDRRNIKVDLPVVFPRRATFETMLGLPHIISSKNDKKPFLILMLNDLRQILVEK